MYLKDWLNENDMTLEEFADKCEFSRGAVAKWISGERFPRIDALKKIEGITDGGVTVQDFFMQAK
jgi:transcriptional regulator with XRE-family HTH domain